MTDTETLHAWGVQLTDGMDRSMCWAACPSWAERFACEWEAPHGCLHNYVVGFTPNPPAPREKAVGGAIIRCPKCHNHFWMHIAQHHVEAIKAAGKWPEDSV
ncbi:hypothetical protein CMO96_02695 [Candidatus Woesebacteria bacterium]|nr:hypothetical protein [Candidatus Woesebacteria bacterium]